MDRNGTFLAGLDPRSARILEIGPSFSPIAPKRGGWKTTIVDHTDRPGLVAKYKNAPVDVSKIEDVDYIWAEGALHDGIPSELHGTYDAIIASHVIEHVVDPISLLLSAEQILSRSGRILLAVPDLRLCFDCLRPVSTTGQVIAAWREKRVRHCWSSVFDAYAYDSRPDGQVPSWSRGGGNNLSFSADFIQTWENLRNYQDKGEGKYLDAHAWTFTPASFSLIMLELTALGLSHWQLDQLIECPALEFLAFLRRADPQALTREALATERMTLLRNRCAELRELGDWTLNPYAGSVQEVITQTVIQQVEAKVPEADETSLEEELARLDETTDALLRMAETLQRHVFDK
jgi:hypothetical protein